MNIFSSFTHVFERNWLKIGRYVPYYLLRKKSVGLCLISLPFQSYGLFSGDKHPRSEHQTLGGLEKKPNHIWKIADILFEGDV